MKSLQQNELPTSVQRSSSTKCTTGNLLVNPTGVPADSSLNYARCSEASSVQNQWNFHHQYNNDITTLTNDEHKGSDEELTSMLQRYLGDDQFSHQKSPGQQSSDSGFSGDQQHQHQQPSLDFSDYDETGDADLSQLVDQVLSSMDAQFNQDQSYMQFVHQQQR